MHAEGHADQRAWPVCELVLFRVQFHSLNCVSGQQAVAKGAHILPTYPLRQKQPQVAAAAAFLQICRDALAGQSPDQVAQILPSLGVISIENEKPCPTFLVKKICAQSNLTSQVIKQVAHIQWFVDADVAAVIKPVGIQVPPLDESLGQHQGWTGEFGVWE